MPSNTKRVSDSVFGTEGNQENEARIVSGEWVLVTFVSFCKFRKDWRVRMTPFSLFPPVKFPDCFGPVRSQ